MVLTAVNVVSGTAHAELELELVAEESGGTDIMLTANVRECTLSGPGWPANTLAP
jgi:hypothetical protein